MKYQALLFDVDGTLLDFKKSEENGLQSVFTSFPVFDRSECISYYKNLNNKLWASFEQGKISKQAIFDTRFSQLCQHFHLPYDGRLMEQHYRKCLNEGHECIEGAYELIKALSQDYALYIITNGTAQTQLQRLKDSKLLPFFQDVFVSENIGYQKPHPAYFAFVAAHVPYLKQDMLVIGDSLSSDILGAKKAGIASVWLRMEHQKAHASIIPDYEIHQPEDLWNIL